MKPARMPHRGLLCLLALLVPAVLAQTTGPDDQDPTAKPPRDSGLVERAERRLVQLDVSVRGPWDVISALGPDDFVLAVNGVPIENLTVDSLCSGPPETRKADAEPDPDQSGSAGTVAARPRVSYLLYFDQRMLTAAGRQNSIDTARGLIPELLHDGGRVAIVSSGKKHETLVDLTDSADRLLEGLERLEGDHDHWVTYATEEPSRIRQVLDAREQVGVYSACGAARRFQVEEAWQVEKSLRIFSLTLGHLSGLDPPKVVFYFADMMRVNAGEHFLAYAGRCSPTTDAFSDSNSSFGGQFALESVVKNAAAHGTRVYTFRGEGLVAASTTERRQPTVRADNASIPTVTNHQRYMHAGDSLNSLAVETGGRSFIHGEAPTKMMRAVERDLDCVYLLSFDPEGLPLDQNLRVSLNSSRPKVDFHSRGRIVIQSDEERKTSELMAAFAAPGSVTTDTPLFGSIVPTGFQDGRYSALIQVRVPASPLGDAEWHFGASLLTRGEVSNSVSGSVKVDRAGVPVVFETEMAFRPGPFELILVGHEAVADQLGARRMEGSWPEPDEGPAVGPIALLQPAGAAFVRAGESKRGGAMALAEQDTLRPEAATAFVGLVCRGAEKSKLRIERTLTGEGTHQFPPMEIDFDKERCAQIRDLIAETTMTSGRFVYRVRMMRGDEVVAAGERTFNALAADTGANGAEDGTDGS
jgi:VWFA-related protein